VSNPVAEVFNGVVAMIPGFKKGTVEETVPV
jgi:hypothetical protein